MKQQQESQQGAQFELSQIIKDCQFKNKNYLSQVKNYVDLQLNWLDSIQLYIIQQLATKMPYTKDKQNQQIQEHLKQILNKTIIESITKQDTYITSIYFNTNRVHLYNINNRSSKEIRYVHQLSIPYFSWAVHCNNQFYIIGGLQVNNTLNEYIMHFELVKILKNKKINLKHFPMFQKYDFAICQNESKVYLINGKDSFHKATSSLYMLDLKDFSFIQLRDSPQARFSCRAIYNFYYNYIVVFGGFTYYNNVKSNTYTIDVYFIKDDLWRSINMQLNIPFNFHEGMGGVFIDNNNLLIFGGCDLEMKMHKETYILNMEQLKLSRLKDLKVSSVFYQDVIKYNNKVYAVGTWVNEPENYLHEFDIEAKSWNIVF